MTTPRAAAPDPASPRSGVLVFLQVLLGALLIFACARIVTPFISILLWSTILAVMLYPLHLWLGKRIGSTWSAWLIGISGVVLAAAPLVLLATSLSSSLSELISGIQNHTLTLRPPPPRLAEVPVVGPKLTAAWAEAAENLPAALVQHSDRLRGLTGWLVAFAGKMVAAEFSFILSFVIATILMAYGASVSAFAKRLLQVLTNSTDKGARLVVLMGATIRGVASGVVGVAAIQALLLGVGFFVIGLPFAAVVTLAIFLLGVVQVPAVLLTLPIIAFAFVTEPLTTAIIFGIWTFVAGLSDNFLKPLLLGRGMEVPMPVILIGVIGGMVVDGLLGLFIGPVILAVAWVLFMDWLHEQPAAPGPEKKVAAP